MSIAPIGVIHGRFQPLHIGHMEYLLAGKKRCKFLYVGVTNPDPSLTGDNLANPQRSRPSSNPFNYFERLLMIRDSLLEFGVARNEFEIVPFPINFPGLLKDYAPTDAVYYATIYDEWGRVKVETLRSLGLQVEVMWQGHAEDKPMSGTLVREMIANGKEWSNLVPIAVFNLIKNRGLEHKVKELIEKDRNRPPIAYM